MIGPVTTIARNTFTESIRQPVFFVLIIACGIGQIANTLLSAYSMGYTEETEVHGDDKLLLDMGLATVMVAGTLLAAFIATSVLSREIDNKTALTVISKPIGRPLFILGKWLGASAAITLAVAVMLLFLLFAIRHGVMSTARDTVDGPVVLFASLGVLLPVLLAIWGNYFYGWVFSSAAVGMMLPATLLGYLMVLLIDEEWAWQAISTDFKPQISLAAFGVLLSMLVLTAVAIAASTRLGQVMTITVAAGAFLLGLLSNHLLGRYAFDNQQIALVDVVETDAFEPELSDPGDELIVRLNAPPRVDLRPGSSFYYAADPEGIAMLVPEHPRFQGDPARTEDVYEPPSGPALIVRRMGEEDLTYVLVNAGGLPIERPPQPGDYVFARPTDIRWAAWGAWALLPNLQQFWLVDAITQGHRIPPRYVALMTGYAGAQVLALLSLSVILFQTRDVG